MAAEVDIQSTLRFARSVIAERAGIEPLLMHLVERFPPTASTGAVQALLQEAPVMVSSSHPSIWIGREGLFPIALARELFSIHRLKLDRPSKGFKAFVASYGEQIVGARVK